MSTREYLGPAQDLVPVSDKGSEVFQKTTDGGHGDADDGPDNSIDWGQTGKD